MEKRCLYCNANLPNHHTSCQRAPLQEEIRSNWHEIYIQNQLIELNNWMNNRNNVNNNVNNNYINDTNEEGQENQEDAINSHNICLGCGVAIPENEDASDPNNHRGNCTRVNDTSVRHY